MSNPIDNCAVCAIAAVTGEAPQDIAAGIAAFPDEDGGPAFVGDAVKTYSVGTYLESRGWFTHYFEDHPSLPWTCLIGVHEHIFAIVNGLIHDRAGGGYFGEPILFVWVPPTSGRGSRLAAPKTKLAAIATPREA